MPCSPYREIMVRCATQAGAILRDWQGRAPAAQCKESISSVVTEADLASERFILQELQTHCPGHNILSEEMGWKDHGSEWTWVVDPLDGTSNFAAGLPWFGVLLCLFQAGRPVLAASYLPILDRLYLAEAGQGVTCQGRRLQLPAESDPSRILLAFGLDACPTQPEALRQARLMAHLTARVRNLRCTNSLVDLCYTLDGHFGAALNFSTCLWDIAPASLMFPEAGGRLCNLQGRPIIFDFAQWRQPHAILATNSALAPKLLPIIQEILAS